MFLAVLAYAATWNLFLCLLLNLVVPFWLIFSKYSPFNLLSYFSCMMTFTFLQLIPVDREGFLIQLTALAFCCVFVIAAVAFYSWKRKRSGMQHTEQRSMQVLGTALERIAKGEESADKSEELKELSLLHRALYQEAYQERGRRHVVTSSGKLKYMFAVLMQRTIYLVLSQSQILKPEKEEVRQLELMLSDYMKKAGQTDFMSGAPKELIREGRRLMRRAEKGTDEFSHYAADFLHLFLFILYQAGKKENEILDRRWKMPAGEKLKDRFLYRMRPDTFEMRFAMRMSLVLMAGMAFNFLFDEGHSYWFVMNAFLLLRPMYEESRYRMRNRFLGTAAGCLIVSAVIPLLGGSLTAHFTLASVMVACMYTAVPGTIIHALFVTCYALTMTTMAMESSMAAVLRLAYVVGAVLFVLIVNRFFFPTSMGSQFRYNFQMLFHMHHVYLRILENGLENRLDYWRLCDAQLQYQVYHGQLKKDLPQAGGEEQDLYREILSLTWRMAAEAQQMIFLTARLRGDSHVRRIMERYIFYTDCVLNQIQEMLHLKREKKLKNIEGMQYQRTIEGEPRLSVLMTRYAKNLSRLYVLVAGRFSERSE